MNLPIDYSKRISFVGATGSGKTYLAKRLASHVSRLVVIDSKGTIGNKWHTVDWSNKTAKQIENGENIRIRVPAVRGYDNRDTANKYDEYFQFLFSLRNLIIYIDEVYLVTQSSSRILPGLNSLYTSGRELNLGVWSSYQRPAHIPVSIVSESDIYMLFHLRVKRDRQTMANMLGDKVLSNPPVKHSFWIFHHEMSEPKLVSPIR